VGDPEERRKIVYPHRRADDVNLREYLERRTDDDTRVMAERVDGHWTLDDERWHGHLREHESHDKYHDREHTATEQAIKVATSSLDGRLGTLDSRLLGLDDRQRASVSHELHDRLEAEMNRRFEKQGADIDTLTDINNRLQGALGIARFVGFGGFLTAAIALVWIILHGGPI
jgi:hypothetical protein